MPRKLVITWPYARPRSCANDIFIRSCAAQSRHTAPCPERPGFCQSVPPSMTIVAAAGVYSYCVLFDTICIRMLIYYCLIFTTEWLVTALYFLLYEAIDIVKMVSVGRSTYDVTGYVAVLIVSISVKLT